MTTGQIKVKVGVHRYCLWPMAVLALLRIPVPKWMFTIEKAS